MKQFEVNRSNFSEHRVAEPARAALADGEVRVAIDFFAFTANNMTYAAAGDMLGYWQFFPASSDAGYGVIPVWGFADVVESQCDGIDVGERLYGYFPPAGELVMRPVKVADRSLFDGSEHRQKLPPLYNRYQRVKTGGDSGAERLQALLGPLYNTSYCLWDQLAENAYYGAEQVLLLSASSKTAIGLAIALADDEQAPRVLGLTSGRNKEFVAGLGAYEAAVGYDEIAGIDQRPTVVVDMAGNAGTAQALREHLGDHLQYFISVGLTHWDQAGGGPADGDERGEFFFAPTYMMQRSEALGAGEFARRAQGFVMQAAARSGAWLQLEEVAGVEAFSERYPAICAGEMNPSEGLICKL